MRAGAAGETGADTTLVVAVQEQSVDGRRTWSQQFDAVAYAETVYPAVRDGSWTETATAPDQTSSVSTYRLGRLETKTAQDNAGTQISQIAYTYDPHGRAASVTDARLGATTYTYYDDDQVETVTVPHPVTNGQFLVTKNFYDARGLLERRQLPDQSETFYAYTAQGQLDRVHGSQTYPLDYDYDAQGRMTAMTTWQDYAGDTGQAVTGWRFDPQRGRLEAKRYADGHEVGYTYTAAGRLDTRTWARGVVTHYGYTADGRLANVGYSDPTPGVTYTYHRHGQVQEVRDGVLAEGVISEANLRYRHAYSYDAALRPLTETIATTGSHDLTRRYEGTATGEVPGRPRGFTLTGTGATAALHTTDYRYDTAGRLQQVVGPAGTFAYTYVANSDLVDTVTGPVVTARNVYQPKGQAVATRTNTVGQAVISRFGYTTNALGQRTAASATGAAFAQATHFVYRYNEKGEVIAGERLLGDDPASPGAAVWPESFAYGFDDIGNRRQATRGDPAAPLARQDYVASPLNLYTSLTASGSAPAAYDFLPAAPVHDLDGNLTDDARWHYTWDAENRLVAMETQPAAVLAGRPHQRLDFAYDYRSRRVAKKVSTYAAGQWTVASDQRFLYDDWNLIADFTNDPQTSTLNLACTYTWGLDLSGSIQGAGGVGGLLAVTRTEGNEEASYFPTYDANGNVSEYVNSTGSIAAHREYGPFGELIRTTGTEGIAPFGFSTKYTDSETSLIYYGLRYYNPTTGRWPVRDAIEEGDGPNMHAFVRNHSTGAIDTLGQQMWIPSGRPGETIPFPVYPPYYGPPSNYGGFGTADWSELVKELVLDQAAVKASFGTGYTIPVSPAVINIGVTGEFKAFMCKDATGRTRKMFEASFKLAVKGGVGVGFGVKRYPEPKGRDRNKIDPATGSKLKNLAGQPLPWRQQRENSGFGGTEFNSSADGGCECPNAGFSGSVAIGIYGETYAIVGGEIQGKLEWNVATPFTWQNINGKIEASLGFQAGAAASVGVVGEGKASWTGYIE